LNNDSQNGNDSLNDEHGQRFAIDPRRGAFVQHDVEADYQRARRDAGCKNFLFVTVVILLVVMFGVVVDWLELTGIDRKLAIGTRVAVIITLAVILVMLSRRKRALMTLVVIEAAAVTLLTLSTALTHAARTGMSPGDYSLPLVMVSVGFLFLLPSTPRTWFLMLVIFVTGLITTLSVLVGQVEQSNLVFTGVQSIAGMMVAAYLGYRDKLRQREEYATSRISQLLAEKLTRLATTDSLTGIANRREFFHAAAKEISRAQRNDRPLSVLIFDIDHFKNINDQYGHAAGDEVLINIVSTCNKTLREIDTIGRIGGEEFGILLPETELSAAASVAERLREGMKVIRPGGSATTGTVTMSVGVAQWRASHEDFEELMARADGALYEAKRNGRNQVVTAD
jgi:diguanylate cyclase (GGDEF)-like protein